ncbi:MAG: ABC transporter substrate-binding protein [Thermodesulfobacteriota bacterium]|nr:ABC transporter substrate-binding protein [Thermodesulfobacteriota bacterium]
MKTIKKLLIVICLSAFIAVSLTGQALATGSKDTLVYALYGDIKDWDPAVAFSLEVYMLRQVYESLTVYNTPGESPQILPGLATSWNTSEDGLTWTFNLRKDVKFHDGESFNAAAVKYVIDRNKKMGKGAAFIWAAVKEVKVVDDHTVQFLLKYPAPIDIIASAQYCAWMYSPGAGEKGTDWFMQGNAVGTGPYKVDKWEKSQQTVLSAFNDYWGGWKDTHFKRVILKVVTEKSTQVQMLKGGEADFASLVPIDSVAGLRKDPAIEILTPPSWKNQMYLINVKKFPTDNLKIRQAISYACDYQGIIDGVLNGAGSIPSGPIPATMWGHDPNLRIYNFDLEKARKLVEESGIPKDKLKLTCAYIGTSQVYSNVAQMLQANLAQIGITLELLPGPWGTIWDKAKNLETAPNLQSMAWWPTYPTPSDWLIGMWRTEEKALFNLSHYANSEYDKLVDAGTAAEGVDKAKATGLYSKAQKILVNDAVAVFYADLNDQVAKRTNIGGFVYNPSYNVAKIYDLYRK